MIWVICITYAIVAPILLLAREQRRYVFRPSRAYWFGRWVLETGDREPRD